jgi:hypothetical protein
MAVDRSLLAQALGKTTSQSYLDASPSQRALLQGQEISKFAMDSSNFGSGQARGVGLAAQLATAGVGAFTQYRAQKDLNEQELASQQQFGKQFPFLADIASTLSPETRQAYTLETIKASLPKAADNQIISGEQGYFAVNKNNPAAQPQPIMGADGQIIKPQKPASTTINVGNDLNKTLTKVDEKVLEKSFEAQAAADEIAPSLNRAKEILTDYKTGAAADLIAGGQKIASAATGGKYQPKSLAQFEELDSISKEIGAQTLKLFGGSDTEKELQVAIRTGILPSDTRESNRNKLERKLAAVEVLQKKPSLQTDWINENGSILRKNNQGQSFSESWRDYQKMAFKERLGQPAQSFPAQSKAPVSGKFTSSNGVSYEVSN